MKDWRLTNQHNYLQSADLFRAKFKEDIKIDHEHCEFCWVKIDRRNPLAYCTKDRKHWICSDCYKDFFSDFCWSVDNKNNEW